MAKEISRREFLENVGVGAAAGTSLLLLKDIAGAESAKNVLPSRTLGRTGAKVSILAFGCGSRFLMYKAEDTANEILNRAIDLGISYLDTAYAYGDGKSETRVGNVMATRRKEVWLATKIPDRTRDEFLHRLEGSLKRLQTDHVDLVHIHSLGQADDLEKIESKDGALKGLMEAREQKEPRCDRDEGDRSGISRRGRSREGGHELAASLFDKFARDDRSRRHAEAGNAGSQHRDRQEFFAAHRSGEGPTSAATKRLS